MSASSQLPAAGAIAHVNFRVRCERLGHGEEVFLVQEGDAKRQKVRGLDSITTIHDSVQVYTRFNVEWVVMCQVWTRKRLTPL